MLWNIVLFIWMTLVILGAFLFAPLADGHGALTPILYFHVPMAWLAVLAFLTGAVYSVQYLKNKEIKYDLYSEAANKLGFLFAVLGTVTGAVWAKMMWHSYWNWDPRQSSIFILLLIYAAYFALRSAVEQPERRAALASVYDILAFVTVPFFIFIMPRMAGMEGLHPDVIGEAVQSQTVSDTLMAVDSALSNENLDTAFLKGSVDSLLAAGNTMEMPVKRSAMSDPKILIVFLSSLAGFTGLFVLMLKQRISLVKIKLKIKQLEQ